MGKKKTPAVSDPVARRAQTDHIFEQVVKAAEYKNAKKGQPVGKSFVYLLPLPALALRWLLGSEGLMLGRLYHLLGPYGSYKSSLFAEAVRWHYEGGGFGFKLETEEKDADILSSAVLNHNPLAMHTESCEHVEAWQDNATYWTLELIKQIENSDPPGNFPVAMGVDSIRAAISKGTLDDIKKVGHAKRRFADEAKMNTDYTKAFKSMTRGHPFTFWVVNHLSQKSNPATGMLERSSGGGDYIKYQMSQEIELHKLGDPVETPTGSTSKVFMRVYKNSYGIEGRRLYVQFLTKQQTEENQSSRLYAKFDWHSASIRLLMGDSFTVKQGEVFLPKIKEVMDIHEKSGGTKGKLFWSDTLGVPSSEAMKAEDLGRILESRCDVLEALYGALRIHRRPYLTSAVESMTAGGRNPQILEQAVRAQQAYDRAQAAGAGVVKEVVGEEEDEDEGKE